MMQQFLTFLEKSGTEYEKISDNEICIGTIAIAAHPSQGDKLPEKEYQENPLLSNEDQIHIYFDENGRMYWSIIHIYEEDEE